jgi:A/G-specific adenine glycosylase
MDSCNAFRAGRIGLLPVKKAPVTIQERRFSYIYVRFNGETAIRRRGPGDIWQGLYEPLTDMRSSRAFGPRDDNHMNGPRDDNHCHTERSECISLSKDDNHCHTERSECISLSKGVKHQLTHRTLIVEFYLWEPSARPTLPEGYFWIKETELDRYGKPRLFELLLESLP